MPSCLGRDIILPGMLIYPGLSTCHPVTHLSLLLPSVPHQSNLHLLSFVNLPFLLYPLPYSFSLDTTRGKTGLECPPSFFVWGPRCVSGNLGKGSCGMLHQLLNSLLIRVFMWSSASWDEGTQTPSRGRGTRVHCTCLLLKNKNKRKQNNNNKKHLFLCARAQRVFLFYHPGSYFSLPNSNNCIVISSMMGTRTLISPQEFKK